jgi:hypothetical protein
MPKFFRVIDPTVADMLDCADESVSACLKKIQRLATQKWGKGIEAGHVKSIYGAIIESVAFRGKKAGIKLPYAIFTLPEEPDGWQRVRRTGKECKAINAEIQAIIDQQVSFSEAWKKIGVKVELIGMSLCRPVQSRHNGLWYIRVPDGSKFKGSKAVDRISDVEIEKITGK